jgi:hypothetical protein
MVEAQADESPVFRCRQRGRRGWRSPFSSARVAVDIVLWTLEFVLYLVSREVCKAWKQMLQLCIHSSSDTLGLLPHYRVENI